VTVRELAKITNVSPAAVSIALNNKKGISEQTRARILKAVNEHGYSNRQKSRSNVKEVLLLKFLGSRMIVEENQSFVSTIIDSIGNELSAHNYRLTMQIKRDSREEEPGEIDFNNFCAAIVVGTELTKELGDILSEIPIPYVVVDNSALGINCNSVTMDNSSNVCIALAYLSECGHRQIGYLRSALQTANFIERNVAFRRWSEAFGFEVANDVAYFLTPTLIGAYTDMCAALEKREKRSLPTCLYADNDTIAIGAIKALEEYGYSVPEDVSIIGMDDIPYASVNAPPLTTVRVQKEMIGQVAVTQLLTLLNAPTHRNIKTYITGELIIRKSVSKLC